MATQTPSTSPSLASPTGTPTPSPQSISPSQATETHGVRFTRCSDVRLPDEGLGEADYGLNETTGSLTINFSDFRRGRYRNVSYTVRYLTDATCLSTPDVAEVIDRVSPKDWPPPE